MLPSNQQVVQPALRQTVGVGETYDFMVEPSEPGTMWLDVRRGGGEWVQQVRMRVTP